MAVTEPSRVLIADDHAPTRALLRAALERGGLVVVAEAATAAQAVFAAERLHPDLALLDIRMPGSGIDAAQTIAALEPAPAIVMLTVSEDDEDMFAALRAGAAGYLLKGMNTEELPGKLRAVLSGEGALPGTLVPRLIDEFRVRERRRFFMSTDDRRLRLTTREWDVLEMLSDGLNTGQIARRMYISPVTVRSHVAAILRKLKVADRDAAVAFLRTGRHPSHNTR
jgi:DNA-binding NarL/FixJ family response regulator